MASASATEASSFLPVPAPAAPLSFGALLRLSLQRPGGQRSITALTSLFVVAAVSMLAFPAVTDLIGGARQAHVTATFNNPRFTTVYRTHHVPVGDGLTRVVIDNPRVKVNVLVVQGTTVAALRAGAGHYTKSPYPCGPTGNVGIAGHRTTFGRPFNRINDMRPGDTVTLITPLSRCVYRVMPAAAAGLPANPFTVLPTDGTVVTDGNDARFGGSPGTIAASPQWLTLTSCTPPGSASYRIVLRLVMISCKGSTCHQQKGST